MMATVEVEAENPPCFAVVAPRARTVAGLRLDLVHKVHRRFGLPLTHVVSA